MNQIETVIRLLTEAGIQTRRGYPGGRMPALQGVAAAVSIDQWAPNEGRLELLVSILAPASLGGSICEDRGMEVCALLTEAGGVCVQGACAYLGKADAFCVEIRVRFREMGSEE